MSAPDVPRFAVHLSGLLRGIDLGGAGTLALPDDAIELAPARGGIVALRLTSIEGVAARGRAVELFVDSGDVLRADEGDDAAPGALALAVARHAYALPEVTRSLRAFGSPRAEPGALHDRFFAPLLAARRRGELLADPHDRARAFEAATLRAGVERLLGELAAERAPRGAPARRALEAELRDCAESLLARLDALERAERALRTADDSVRLARWRGWTAALVRTFEEADACWIGLRPAVERPRADGPRWRRWLDAVRR